MGERDIDPLHGLREGNSVWPQGRFGTDSDPGDSESPLPERGVTHGAGHYRYATLCADCDREKEAELARLRESVAEMQRHLYQAARRITRLVKLLKNVSMLQEAYFKNPGLRAAILRELKGEWK